ncbi:hypothetical protein B566_EDAN018099 [Ephemera danica]|nr:hypothetical protein B566_EDAN018099 [Ephemera danica]
MLLALIFRCKNHRNDVPVKGLSSQPDTHERLHEALQMLDCATVCRLLRSGMKLCCLRMDSCISLIAKHCTSTFLNSALNLYPSAINWRGSRGATLLMMCKTPENFQTVLDHGADVKATNLDYENVLLYNVKYRPGQVKDIFYRVYRTWTPEKDMENLEEKWKDLLRLILNSGVDLDAEDKEGQTALQILLKMFKPGYVFQPDHSKMLSQNTLTLMCLHGSKIASSILSVFLEAGVKLPAPDQHGRTPLMLAVQCPLNFENMRTLIGRGVDINAVDVNVKNAIYHLLASVHEHIEFAGNECEIDFLVVDQMVSFLLDHGCHMQGTNLLMSKNKNNCVKFKIVNYLMALEESTLKERDFSQKLEAKNDSINLSFLSLYLMARAKDEFPLFDLSDVAYIKQEIADGLDVNCGDHHSEVRYYSEEAMVWKKRLSLPFPLLITMDCKLQFYTENHVDNETNREEAEEVDRLIKQFKETHQAVEDIQKLLLPFWPHPPLTLLLFDQTQCCDEEPNQEIPILLRKRLIRFLYEVGGPLSPGSEIYHAVKERLESNAAERRAPEVPSLRQLSRTALRSSLKKTDTKGLDVSSLRALCEGEMRPLPPDIVDLINFKKSSVSEMKVVPEMVSYLFN